ncbi:MAG: hypothetical protein HYX71_10385 [Opitutae bacterium]|nr:hypothetical protein [Opitutae bacterium]
MRIEVIIAATVRDYLRRLAPEPRKLAKAALSSLPRGDTKPLTDEFTGFYRLRVGQHRFIYRYQTGRLEVIYAAPRALVYEYLAAHFREFLG